MKNNKQLYKDLKSYYKRFIDTDEIEIAFLVLYVTGTHYFNEYETYPILHICGDYETGKNRRLDLMEIFCYEPIILTNPSLSSIFRLIDERSGTILIDEADVVLGYQDFEGLLLAGYKKGGQTSRSKIDKDFTPEMFTLYCPKVVVSREGLSSDALRSRSITIITSPKSKDSVVPDILRENDKLEGLSLRKKLDSLLSEIENLESHDIGLNLHGRKAEIFDCLSDVACMYGEEAIIDLKNFVEKKYIPECNYITMMTLNEHIIRILFNIWNDHQFIYIRDIKLLLQKVSGDYYNTHEKQIAGALRGLNFDLSRNRNGTFVIKNSEILKIWSERYEVSLDEAESTDTSNLNYLLESDNCEEDVANEAKFDKGRPKRVSTWDKFRSIHKKIFKGK